MAVWGTSSLLLPLNCAAKVAPSNFRKLSDDLGGTRLRQFTIKDALSEYYAEGKNRNGNLSVFPMGQYPDPMLRRIANPTQISSMSNSNDLIRFAHTLRNTCRKENAVGLAAQQCGIDASLVFLETQQLSRNDIKTSNTENKKVGGDTEGIFLVNPRFVYRSPEKDMLVWDEKCLVMPSNFIATVLRDKRVVVEAEDLDGRTIEVDLRGEIARACQHECQHDKGILIVDHVDLENDKNVSYEMRMIEKDMHDERQLLAFERDIVNPSPILSGGKHWQETHVLSDTTTSYIKPNARLTASNKDRINRVKVNTNEWLRPRSAMAYEKSTGISSESVLNESEPKSCDEECRERIMKRRALMQQSRSTTSRQQIMDLSKQRALLYNTTYQGASCSPNIPCL